jgi:hypothetical protein
MSGLSERENMPPRRRQIPKAGMEKGLVVSDKPLISLNSNGGRDRD